MIFVRLFRTAPVIAVIVLTAWLVPSRGDAAVSHHRTAHARSCVRVSTGCLALKWHIRVDRLRYLHSPDLDDVDDDADDRDARMTPTSVEATDDERGSSSDAKSTPPWLRARVADEPRAARLIAWRKLAAPRPPPSI